MKLCRGVALLCIVAITGVPAMARAQFTYQPPQTSSQGTVNVWNDFRGMSGTAPVSIYGYGSWQTVPWPSSGACGSGGLYSQQPSYSPSDWQLGTFQGRGPAYQITPGPGNTTIRNNRLELNSSPGNPPPLGTPNDSCRLLLEPASTCSVSSGCISSAYFKWSTYISSAGVITDGLRPYDWGAALFQMHPVDTGSSSGAWPGLTVELDSSGTPYLVFATQCTAGTPGCRLLDSSDPNSTALDWKAYLSQGYLGRWVDFAFYIKLSTGQDGVQTLWVDGQQVASWTGPNMYSSPSGHPRLNVQHGYYRLSTATSTSPLYQTPVLYSTTTPTTTGGPVITSGPSANPGPTSATITWTTNAPSTSQVDYGTSSTALTSSTPLDSTEVTSHSVQLSGLSPRTTYYYLARSSATGGTTTSSVSSFTTGQLFTDTFNRTTGLGPNWKVQYGSFTTDGTYAISGAPPANGNWAAVNVALGTNDYASITDMIVPAGSLYSGIVARSSDPANFDRNLYAAQIATNGTVSLYRRNDWNWTLLGSIATPINANQTYHLKLIARGANPTHLEVWLDYVLKVSFDDASPLQITSGAAGLENYDPNVKHSLFSVYSE